MRRNEILETAAVRRVALFAPCSECRCEGFRPWIEGVPANYEKQNGLFYFSLSIYDEYEMLERCMRCDHELHEHTNAVVKMSDDDREHYSRMVHDASRIFTRVTNEHEKTKLKILLQVYEAFIITLRKSIMSPERLIVFGAKELQPWTSPNAVEVLATYLCSLTDDSDHREKLFQLGTEMLTRFNLWEPPLPEKFDFTANQISPQTYKLFYSQWFIRVYLPQKYGTMKQFEFPEIFGIKTMRLFLKFFLQEKFENKKKNALYIFCTRVHDDFEYIRKIAMSGKYAKETVVNTLAYRRHVNNHRGVTPDADLFATPKLTIKPEGSLNHNQMLSCLARIVELERGDHFCTDKFGEDKMSADVAKAEIVKQEVEAGVVRFCFMANRVDNTQSHADLGWMVQLKTLFNAQLPKMGAEYITRLIFDPTHQNLALIRNCRVIGGCCFRPFPDRKFVEIVFLAVSSHDQIKGYGTILMNYMKDYSVRKGMLILLTFADSFATGYFKKQGFSSDLDVPKKIYQGFIKEYEGATLMACQLHPKMRYVTFAPYIKAVRDMQAALHTTMNPIRSKVYRGLDEKLFEKVNLDEETNAVPMHQIPGLKKIFRGRMEIEDVPENLEAILYSILMTLKLEENAWPFLEPVREEECPEYKDFVRFPMDIQTMTERLHAGYYVHQRLFLADLARIFDNCFAFNAADTEYFRCGVEMKNVANDLLLRYFPGNDISILPEHSDYEESDSDDAVRITRASEATKPRREDD